MKSPFLNIFGATLLVHTRASHFWFVHRIMHPWRISWLPDIGKVNLKLTWLILSGLSLPDKNTKEKLDCIVTNVGWCPEVVVSPFLLSQYRPDLDSGKSWFIDRTQAVDSSIMPNYHILIEPPLKLQREYADQSSILNSKFSSFILRALPVTKRLEVKPVRAFYKFWWIKIK